MSLDPIAKPHEDLDSLLLGSKELKIYCDSDRTVMIAKYLISKGYFILAGENYVLAIKKIHNEQSE